MRGFTILEALIAIVLFIVSAVSIFAAVGTGMNTVRDIKENALASAALQAQIETVRSNSNLPAVGTYNFNNTPLSNLVNGIGTVSVNQYDVNLDANLLIVVIRVTWDSRLQSTKHNTKRLGALIANKGLGTIVP